MSEVRQTTPATAANSSSSQETSHGQMLPHAPGWRLDQAHPLATAVEAPASAATSLDVVETPTPRIDAPEVQQTPEELLAQARELSAYVDDKYLDLQRREQRLQIQLAEMDRERRALRLWMNEGEAVLQQRDAELVLRDTRCSDREAACLALEHELQARKAEILHREKLLEEETNLRQQRLLQEEVDAQVERQRLFLQLENDRSAWEEHKQAQAAELKQDSTLLQNRLRFQEEHLRKLRADFDTDRRAFHQEQQQLREWLGTRSEQLSLHARQLAAHREWLEQWATSISRESDLLEINHRVGLRDIEQLRAQLDQDRFDFQRQRQIHLSELDATRQGLRQQALQLETRQQKLEGLRREQEEAQRRTLELRQALEEACAVFAEQQGPETAREQLELARREVADHYRRMREDLFHQRRELEHASQQLDAERNRFREEQDKLASWVTQQENTLRERDAHCREMETGYAAREQAWQQTRDRWSREKQEAEAIIRDLLTRNAPPLPDLPAAQLPTRE